MAISHGVAYTTAYGTPALGYPSAQAFLPPATFEGRMRIMIDTASYVGATTYAVGDRWYFGGQLQKGARIVACTFRHSGTVGGTTVTAEVGIIDGGTAKVLIASHLLTAATSESYAAVNVLAGTNALVATGPGIPYVGIASQGGDGANDATLYLMMYYVID